MNTGVRTKAERIADWTGHDSNSTFVAERKNNIGCVVTAVNRETLEFWIVADDDHYWHEEAAHLGQFLTDLGLTAEDCGRAIEAWKRANAK